MSLHRVWRWHDEPALIAAAAKPWGRVALWIAAVLLLPDTHRVPVGLVLAPALIWPERRIDLLALAAVATLLGMVPAPAGPDGIAVRVAGALAVLGVLFASWQAAHRFQQLPLLVRRYPVAATHVALLGVVSLMVVVRRLFRLGDESALGVITASLEVLLPFVIWRVSYMMLAGRRGTAAKHRFRDHFFYLMPVWGGTKTPYGKGHGYLMERRVEGDTELAAVRLAGIKLLGLAWLWTWVDLVLMAGVHGDTIDGLGFLTSHTIGMPRLYQAIAAGPASYGLLERWAIVIMYLVRAVIGLAAVGHVVIGSLRLFGFRVFRNTYKPLLASTLIDFWNRYYFYFKELLVEFYFYPTYVATSRFSMRVRMFLSVMAAACVGNLYYHLVLRDFDKYFLVKPHVMLDRVAGHVTYAVLLGLAIFASMRREQARRGKVVARGGPLGMLRRVRAIAGVWIVFGVLQIWLVELTTLQYVERARFCLGLVGITGTREAGAPAQVLPKHEGAPGPHDDGL